VTIAQTVGRYCLASVSRLRCWLAAAEWLVLAMVLELEPEPVSLVPPVPVLESAHETG